METCSQHDGMCKKIDEIHTALLGTLDRPGWIGRVADMEKTSATKENLNTVTRQLGVVMRIGWYILGGIGAAVLTTLLSAAGFKIGQ